MAIAGQGVFAGLYRPTRNARLFEQRHAPSLGRKMQRRGKGVVPCAHKDRVVAFGHFMPHIVTGIFANAFKYV